MPNGAMVEGSSTTGRAKTKAWRGDVSTAAMLSRAKEGLSEPLGGALHIGMLFRLPKPKSRPKKAGAVIWHIVKPDKDKLIRATLDGLCQGGLVGDDALFASGSWRAVETTGWSGAIILIQQLTPGLPEGTDIDGQW